MSENNHFCVILAGGKGMRLWPCSREVCPKQFVDFFGTGRTLLQQTFDRFAGIVPRDHIYVNTNKDYVHLVREQLPELNVENLLAEPVHRNTAPSMAWACHRISRRCPDADIIVTPSDQLILDEEAFKQNVNEGFVFVQANNCLLTMGVKPTRPEPGYGYIQIGKQVGGDLYQVQSFTEKPEREFARLFMESGEFYWNTGLFLSNVRFLKTTFCELLPSVLRNLEAENPDHTIEEENAFIKEHFSLYPNLSIDYGILEKSEAVYVMKCDFGWADIGTWHSIYEAMRKSEDDNVIINSDVLLEDSRNNVIKLSEGKLGVISGLDGYIVAEKDNVLFICKKGDSSALVRKYVSEVQMKRGDAYV